MLLAPPAFAQTRIVLDDADSGRVFEGIGAVSAGASTRNLADYPGKQMSEVMDYMFKPKFGAGLQHLKVEIGGGENSTCGSEPTHALTREELANPVPRGYEFWLMAEARKRNPKVILDCLPWSFPGWVSGAFSQDSADWFVAFLDAAKKHYGLKMDWVAAGWNEKGTDLNWIVKILRPTMDAHGYADVKLDGFTPGTWHHLALGLKAGEIRASVDGKEVACVQNDSRKNGMVYLMSSYDPNCFDNLSVTP